MYALLLALSVPPPAAGIVVPPGFVVTQFAGPDLVPDCYHLHIDDKGRLLASGRGYIREVIDRDGDGVAETSVELVSRLQQGPMGVLREGDDLFFVADGGLKQLKLTPGQPADATTARTLVALKTGSEHDAHAVRRGADGDLYLLCGNNAGVSAKTVRGRSPITDPVAGCLLKLSPDASRVEIVADGFRNPYDFDFDLRGEPFTYDSDNERCVSLPWYEPTRFYHVVPGGKYGWRNPQLGDSWRLAPDMWDVVPPTATLGRGSPTGVVCYRHTGFPQTYYGGFFLADWTFGRVDFVPLTPNGSSYVGTPQQFVKSVGEGGFAPTGMAVHPTTGDLYVATGGRSARGAIYRVSYVGPRSGQIVPIPVPRVGEREPATVVRAASSPSAFDRGRAIEDMAARPDAFAADIDAAILSNAGHADRLVRQDATRLARTLSEDRRARLLARCDSNAARVSLAFALPAAGVDVGLSILANSSARRPDRLDACRLILVSVGDLTDPKAKGGVYEGYSPRRPLDPAVADRISTTARMAYPTRHPDLDRELLRLSAVTADAHPTAVANALSGISPSSDLLDDIHALIVLSRLPAPRTDAQRRTTAEALLRLEAKAAGRNRDRNWPLRIAEVWENLVRRDAPIAEVLTRHPDFGRADHVVFTRLAGVERVAAARRFVARAQADAEFAWTGEHVRLLEALPPAEVRELLPQLWERGGLEDDLLLLLARTPTPTDRAKYRGGLRSSRPATVAASANALAALPTDTDDLAGLIRCLKTLPDSATEARKQVVAALAKLTGATAPDFAGWQSWATANAPAVAAKLTAEGGDVAATRRRLADTDWAAGDPISGKRVFAKASCAACHNGNQAVGPSLDGVTKRFGRADLLTAILSPDADVSARYRITRVGTTDGKQYDGVVLYEATDGVILQTGASETVRIAGDRIESQKSLDKSLMPAGLLDQLSKREVADLFAYLQTLGAK